MSSPYDPTRHTIRENTKWLAEHDIEFDARRRDKAYYIGVIQQVQKEKQINTIESSSEQEQEEEDMKDVQVDETNKVNKYSKYYTKCMK